MGEQWMKDIMHEFIWSKNNYPTVPLHSFLKEPDFFYYIDPSSGKDQCFQPLNWLPNLYIWNSEQAGMVDGRFKKGLSGLFTEVEHLKSKEKKTVYKILQVPIMLAIPRTLQVSLACKVERTRRSRRVAACLKRFTL